MGGIGRYWAVLGGIGRYWAVLGGMTVRQDFSPVTLVC